MLDQMSAGRLELGVGRGASPYEAAFFGIDPKTSTERFDEALAIVLQGPDPRAGSITGAPTSSYDGVPLEVQPVQQPHPPLWHATARPRMRRDWRPKAATWRSACPTTEAAAFTAAYRKAWQALERLPQDMPFVGKHAQRRGGRQRSRHDRRRQARLPRLVRFAGPSVACARRGACPTQIFPSDFDEARRPRLCPWRARSRVVTERLRADIEEFRHQLRPLPLRLRRSLVRGVRPLRPPVRARRHAGAGPPGLPASRETSAIGTFNRGLRWAGEDDPHPRRGSCSAEGRYGRPDAF